MKLMTKITTAVMVAGLVSTASAQYSGIESDNGSLDVDMTVTAEVTALEISVSKGSDLNFGTILTSVVAGTVEFNARNVATLPVVGNATPAAQLTAIEGESVKTYTDVQVGVGLTPSVGAFFVGSASHSASINGAVFEVTQPATVTLTNLSPAGGTMDVTSIHTNSLTNEFTVANAVTDLAATTAVLGAEHAIQVAVGGTLEIGALQPEGTYQGATTLTFAWK